MSHWKDEKRWSDRFLPEIKRILGEHLIGEPPVEEDAERNTDLMVLRLDAVRIGCRVRRYEQIAYCNEFTIRSKLASGKHTELTKIIAGWGDYFFYGFSNQYETKLCHWILGDLKALRLYINRQLYMKKQPWITEITNKDTNGRPTSFVVFRYANIDNPPFVIAQSENIYQKEKSA